MVICLIIGIGLLSFFNLSDTGGKIQSFDGHQVSRAAELSERGFGHGTIQIKMPRHSQNAACKYELHGHFAFISSLKYIISSSPGCPGLRPARQPQYC
jgi:hypothetical protein